MKLKISRRHLKNRMSDLPHIVIIGGGFGGVAAARAFKRENVRVTLIDKNNYHLFQPLLYQVATGGLNASDIAQPIRRIFRKQDNVQVIMGNVVEVQAEEKNVLLEDGTHLDFDFLVIAAGMKNAYFGNDLWEKNAPGLKSIRDSLEIRRKVYAAYEEAERRAQNGETVDSWLTFCVVGGGATGVELAGALREIGLETLKRDFRSISSHKIRVILIEGGDRLVAGFHPSLSEKVAKRLRKIGVEVFLNTRVSDIDNEGLTTSDQRIDARTVVWAAGVAAADLAATASAPTDRRGRLVVNSDLSVIGHSEVFAVGDIAQMMTAAGDEVPGMAQGAIQSAKHAAKNILATLADGPRTDFVYKDKGSMAAIGRNAAVVETSSVKMFGFFAWLFWWLLHIYFIVGYRNRAFTFISWIWNYLTFGRGARLITEVPSGHKIPTTEDYLTQVVSNSRSK